VIRGRCIARLVDLVGHLVELRQAGIRGHLVDLVEPLQLATWSPPGRHLVATWSTWRLGSRFELEVRGPWSVRQVARPSTRWPGPAAQGPSA